MNRFRVFLKGLPTERLRQTLYIPLAIPFLNSHSFFFNPEDQRYLQLNYSCCFVAPSIGKQHLLCETLCFILYNNYYYRYMIILYIIICLIILLLIYI